MRESAGGVGVMRALIGWAFVSAAFAGVLSTFQSAISLPAPPANCASGADTQVQDIVTACTALIQSHPDADTLAAAYSNRAAAYDRLHKYDLAIADRTTLIRMKPDDAMALRDRGDVYDDADDDDRAIADYERSLRLKPDDAVTFNNRGYAYARMKRYDDAVADYNRAMTLDPNYELALVNRARAYRDSSRYDLAIADFTQAVKMKPDDASAFRERGDT